MLVYIWFRFGVDLRLSGGGCCLLSVDTNTIITIGLFSLFGKEITLTVIAALLTLVGYSMNDTIVIFDRIRENNRLNNRESLGDVINKSVNQTLSRTVMTSGLTFLAVIALFLFGGPVLHGFAFALVVGILIGTYSSVFVASPILVFWHNWSDATQEDASCSTGDEAGGRCSGKTDAEGSLEVFWGAIYAGMSRCPCCMIVRLHVEFGVRKRYADMRVPGNSTLMLI